jgi:hypothetical protein
MTEAHTAHLIGGSGEWRGCHSGTRHRRMPGLAAMPTFAIIALLTGLGGSPVAWRPPCARGELPRCRIISSY